MTVLLLRFVDILWVSKQIVQVFVYSTVYKNAIKHKCSLPWYMAMYELALPLVAVAVTEVDDGQREAKVRAFSRDRRGALETRQWPTRRAQRRPRLPARTPNARR